MQVSPGVTQVLNEQKPPSGQQTSPQVRSSVGQHSPPMHVPPWSAQSAGHTGSAVVPSVPSVALACVVEVDWESPAVPVLPSVPASVGTVPPSVTVVVGEVEVRLSVADSRASSPQAALAARPQHKSIVGVGFIGAG
jgi:hypothetical protein